MPAIGGATLRAWRRSRGWDVPEVARQLRRAARDTGQTIAAHEGLVRMIRDWERGDHQLTERYELLYAAALGISPAGLAAGPGRRPPGEAGRDTHMAGFTELVRRLMDDRSVSVRGLAKLVHYDQGGMSRILCGLQPCPPYLACAIDDALEARGAVITAAREQQQAGSVLKAAREARDVMAWITGTNASDDAIEEMARAAAYLAEAHTRIAPRKILPEVLGVHQAVQDLLRGGRQRLRQTRELLRIDSGLLAHACLLLSDLGHYQAAREYGSAALLSAQEAEADEGIAWSVMAKTARWQVRFTEAAELARRGFEVSTCTPVRTELAYREANAIALFGDAPRARAALQRAERAAEDLDDDGTSAWSFSRQRQAIFALSVCLHTGDPDSAFRAAATADAYWDAGGAKVTATWAQVRAGAAMAYLLKDSLDGAAAQLGPVLELPPELRIRTVTGYLDEVSEMLAEPRFAGSSLGAGLRQQISEFNASAT